MITASDIYAATDKGLTIILHYYPQAQACVGTKKAFKIRPNESDESAYIREYDACWKVTDFGDEDKAKSPIDICMREENLVFKDTIKLLASRYGLTNDGKDNVNMPDIRVRPATDSEKEGEKFWELAECFTPEQLKILGPRVKQEHVDALNWYVAIKVCTVKDRKVTEKYTTPTYPIFMRECRYTDNTGNEKTFYKVYEPLNADKKWRFTYMPIGAKPRDYINGLRELQKAYSDYNATEEKAFNSTKKDDSQVYKEKKLREVFICSGERDALCLRALGYHPVWFNSETSGKTAKDMKELSKYAEVIYNIPDIDETGIIKGRELALKYLDVHTIWLPRSLSLTSDLRGKPRKDFRDYVELHPTNQDFRNLLEIAMPARFWTQSWNEKTKKTNYEIDTDCLHYFLSLNGFYTLRDPNSDAVKYIRIDGATVDKINSKNILSFLRSFAMERYLPRDIRNLLKNSTRTGESSLQQLDEIELDFTNYTMDSRFLFFDNA